MKFLIVCLVLLQSYTFSFPEHEHGKPLSIFQFTSNSSVNVDYDAIDGIFLHPEVVERKIVIVSIIGALRKGKSFLMDYFLRFMYANFKSINFLENPLSNKREWIGESDEPLKGFSWKSGAHRDTSGVVIWSDVFLHDAREEKLAIVLVDTQGLFDAMTAPADNSRIFALGTLISSMQIVNLNGVIQEDQLEYLHMATDYATFTATVTKKNSHQKPFQNLMFLMRDWAHDYEYDFGIGGGALYLADVLHVKDDQSPKLIAVRKYIQNSFKSVQCYLMPHPGFKVVGTKNYDGRWSELDEKFKFHLEDLTEWLLKPRNLKKKKIFGEEVIGRTFSQYMKNYFEIFQSPKTPQMKSIYEMTVEAQLKNYVDDAMKLYKTLMENVEVPNNPDSIENFDEGHRQAKLTAILMYRSQRKMGSSESDLKYEKELETEIDLHYAERRESLLITFSKISELKIQTEAELKALNEESERKFQEHTMQLRTETLRFEQEKAERERQVMENLAMKEEEKNAAILKIQQETERHRIVLEQNFKNLKVKQEAEHEQISREVEERARKNNEEIERLKSGEELRKRQAELKLQSEREERQIVMKQEAAEKIEIERIAEERRAKEAAILTEERRLQRERVEQEEKRFLDEKQLAESRRKWEEDEMAFEKSREKEHQKQLREEYLKDQEIRELQRQRDEALLKQQVSSMKSEETLPGMLFRKTIQFTANLINKFAS